MGQYLDRIWRPNAQIDWDNFVNFVTTNPMNNQANYNQAKSVFNTGSLIDYFLLNAYVVYKIG